MDQARAPALSANDELSEWRGGLCRHTGHADQTSVAAAIVEGVMLGEKSGASST
jgi:hypothetical protein